MRNLLFIFSILIVTSSVFSQRTSTSDSHKNEIKLNTLFLAGGYAELSYERALGRKSAIGASVGTFIGSAGPNYATDILTYDFSALPYYRYYFGKQRTSGFFLESNVNVFLRESSLNDSSDWGLGIGLGLGAKFNIKKTWIIDVVAGGGSNSSQEPCGDSSLCFPDVYPRLGISIGKRF